jgi:hypothetical protein
MSARQKVTLTKDAYTVTAEQVDENYLDARVKLTCTAKSGWYNGYGGSTWIKPYLDGTSYDQWAFPSLGSWKNRNGQKQLQLGNGTWITLYSKYWNPATDGYTVNSTYTVYKWIRIQNEIGKNREASKTVSFGTKSSNITSSSYKGATKNITLYTRTIPEPSNVSFSGSVDSKDTYPRYIRLSASFTNQQSFYTGYLTGPGVNQSTSGSTSAAIPVDSSMFSTTKTYNFTIKGKDGTVYYNKNVSLFIEPGGVGIWYREGDTTKEVYHLYYKTSGGQIIEVNEAWYRRNSQNVLTVK